MGEDLHYATRLVLTCFGPLFWERQPLGRLASCSGFWAEQSAITTPRTAVELAGRLRRHCKLRLRGFITEKLMARRMQFMTVRIRRVFPDP